ncbi:DUF3331 domain-containing protein [Paraburkholderia kururiensis]|uniref:DUF3331 domain-containing protein n=1 Tax=Paraburkholderia kururiensis TaxID=984307 RepID=UPI000F88676C|nr:DUF3331 domain-containing protein [Paraburkholderia kururiensis]
MDFATNMTTVDPWTQTLGLLSQLCGGDTRPAARGREAQAARMAGSAAASAGTSSAPAQPGSAMRRSVSLSVIERPTSTTVTIAWRDATHCSYGDQLWHVARARRSGICAMSGRAIRRGDLVYHPRRSRPKPLNDGAMILASVLCEVDAG